MERVRSRPTVDQTWWTSGWLEGRSMREIMAARDIGAVFKFLSQRGWSRAAIAAATAMAENRGPASHAGRPAS